MRVLVVGKGAREHALVWKLTQSPTVGKVFASPGNAGMAEVAELRPTPADAGVDAYVDLALHVRADLTVVGGETLLVAGIVDEFRRRGLPVFGPTSAAARLEGSKIWAKRLMNDVGIPTAAWRDFAPSARAEAREYAATLGWRCVVKADGLAGGKGSIVCQTREAVEAALRELDEKFGPIPILIEECLDGQEVSVFALSDGRTVVPFGAAQDHKRALDGDLGPNTGGMGAYSPVEHMRLAQAFAERFFRRVITSLASLGNPYHGVIYAGAIATADGPRILEFNCRFGDPEAQVLLTRLSDQTDLAQLFLGASEGRLHEVPAPTWRPKESLCVVIATKKYVGKTREDDAGREIHGLSATRDMPGVVVFHAGTEKEEPTGKVFTTGGRILSVTALGDTLEEARALAYKAVRKISFKDMWVRRDIGMKALGTSWEDLATELQEAPPVDEVRTVVIRGIDQVTDELRKLQNDAEDNAPLFHRLQALQDRLDMIKDVLDPFLPDYAHTLTEGGSVASNSSRARLAAVSAEFDELFEQMQDPEWGRITDAGFRASPQELGAAAVAAAAAQRTLASQPDREA